MPGSRASIRSSRACRRRAPRTVRRWRAGTCGSGTRARLREARRPHSGSRRTGSRRWRPPFARHHCSLERVAALDLAGRETLAEPLLALLAGTVREGFLVHVALDALLDRVVADGLRRGECFFDVALLDELARAVRGVRPDAGVTIRLQLHAHLPLVHFFL